MGERRGVLGWVFGGGKVLGLDLWDRLRWTMMDED